MVLEPPDIVESILSWCTDAQTLVRATRTCKAFHATHDVQDKIRLLRVQSLWKRVRGAMRKRAIVHFWYGLTDV